MLACTQPPRLIRHFRQAGTGENTADRASEPQTNNVRPARLDRALQARGRWRSPASTAKCWYALLSVFDYVLLDLVKSARLVMNHVICQSDSVNWVGD